MNIDLKLLKQQKQTLVKILSDKKHSFTKKEKEHLDGILHLLDAIQDANEPDGIAITKLAQVLSNDYSQLPAILKFLKNVKENEMENLAHGAIYHFALTNTDEDKEIIVWEKRENDIITLRDLIEEIDLICEMGQLILNQDSLKLLKKEYEKAVKDKKEIFVFEGHELLTSYAKYLIEYAETKLKK